jgi:hypothetical protein
MESLQGLVSMYVGDVPSMQAKVYMIYEAENADFPKDASCPICLSEYCESKSHVCRLSCGHTLHADCLNRMFLHYHDDCPICRRCILFDRDHLHLYSKVVRVEFRKEDHVPYVWKKDEKRSGFEVLEDLKREIQELCLSNDRPYLAKYRAVVNG